MALSEISIPLAFLAGFASFLSPCVLPLVPPYLAYLGQATARPAMATADGAVLTEANPRVAVMVSGGAFVTGVSLVFVAFFYLLSTVLAPVRNSPLLPVVSGTIIILMALQVAGVLRIPWLMREYRVSKRAPNREGAVGGFLLGLSFAAGWTPCIGATLGAVLTSAINEGTSAYGLVLILVYCVGLGLPFLVLAAGLGSAGSLVTALNRHRRAIDLSSAAVLLVMGLLVLTNKLTYLSTEFSRIAPDWLDRLTTR